MQTSVLLLVGVVSALYVCTNVCWAQTSPLCTSLVACVHPSSCEPIPSCPKGLKIGYPPCGCCKACVIPEGGYCFDDQSDQNASPKCERGLECCQGLCSPDCEKTTTESTSTTESTTTDDSSTSTTQTTTEGS